VTVATAVVVLVLFEITSGTLSSKYTLRENLTAQLDLLLPFFGRATVSNVMVIG
jgi:hypothetical protein